MEGENCQLQKGELDTRETLGLLANGLDLVLEAAGMLPSSLPENLFFFSFLFLNAAATSLNSQAKALFGQTLKDSKDTDRDPVLSLPGVIEDLPQDPHYHLLDFDPQDLLLGGLFPIHKREDGGTLCGDIQDEDGDEQDQDNGYVNYYNDDDDHDQH